ncbi:MAG: hypothetical protein HY876_08115 [Coriobacteriales bacterium]|nr:hypothetical protein [Coriobacteriales bacterium]
MSLSTALHDLPDDRETRHAVRQVLSYLAVHPRERVDAERVASVTGLSFSTVHDVVAALARGLVVECFSGGRLCTYSPSIGVRTEVDRFLYSAERAHSRLQGSVERFRGGYARGR